MIYVASPYTSPVADVRQQRYEAVLEYTAQLMADDKLAFSPIVYGHAFAKVHSIPFDAGWWRNFNFTVLIRCSLIHVLKLPGWDVSSGIKDELTYARQLNIPEYHIEWPA